MKISEVIEKAIEEKLWNGENMRSRKEPFSCLAIFSVYFGNDNRTKIDDTVTDLLNKLGLPYDGPVFKEFSESRKRQYARALWLTFVIEYLKDNPEEDSELGEIWGKFGYNSLYRDY